eukprot:860891-Pleurochrysis_carterae.AAC.1
MRDRRRVRTNSRFAKRRSAAIGGGSDRRSWGLLCETAGCGIRLPMQHLQLATAMEDAGLLAHDRERDEAPTESVTARHAIGSGTARSRADEA